MLRRYIFLMALGCSAGLLTGQTLSFEVADIKPNKSGSRVPSGDFLPGGRLTLRNVSMKEMLAGAFNTGEYGVGGAPAWTDQERFDVIAKAAPTTSEEDLRRMFQSFLVERFHLEFHREEKTMQVYLLTAPKSSSKLKESAEGAAEPACSGARGKLACRKMTMALLAEVLPGIAPRYITLPVLDQTGLKGEFDFPLEWTPIVLPNAPGAAADGDGPAVTIFDAIQELGLKLESRKHTMPVIVVDKLDRLPEGN